MDIKNGLKTTEFWLTLIVVIATYALVFTGRVKDIQEAVALAGGVMAAVGYAVSRGRAKTHPDNSGGGGS